MILTGPTPVRLLGWIWLGLWFWLKLDMAGAERRVSR